MFLLICMPSTPLLEYSMYLLFPADIIQVVSLFHAPQKVRTSHSCYCPFSFLPYIHKIQLIWSIKELLVHDQQYNSITTKYSLKTMYTTGDKQKVNGELYSYGHMVIWQSYLFLLSPALTCMNSCMYLRQAGSGIVCMIASSGFG